jgi:hypothetical protein
MPTNDSWSRTQKWYRFGTRGASVRGVTQHFSDRLAAAPLPELSRADFDLAATLFKGTRLSEGGVDSRGQHILRAIRDRARMFSPLNGTLVRLRLGFGADKQFRVYFHDPRKIVPDRARADLEFKDGLLTTFAWDN